MAASDLRAIIDDLRRIEKRIAVELDRHHPDFDAPNDLYWASRTLTKAAENVAKAIGQVGAVAVDDEKSASNRCSCRKR